MNLSLTDLNIIELKKKIPDFYTNIFKNWLQTTDLNLQMQSKPREVRKQIICGNKHIKFKKILIFRNWID